MVNIDDFIEENKEHILEEHIDEFRYFQVFLESYSYLKKIVPCHGKYFINFPWACNDAEQEPNACRCI